MTRSGFERLVAVGMEAVGMEATGGTRRQVESAIRQLAATAVDRGEAVVDEWVGRGRGSTADVIEVAEVVRREVARQSAFVGARLDELESRLRRLTSATDPRADAEHSPTSERHAGPEQQPRKKNEKKKKKKKKKPTQQRQQAKRKPTATRGSENDGTGSEDSKSKKHKKHKKGRNDKRDQRDNKSTSATARTKGQHVGTTDTASARTTKPSGRSIGRDEPTRGEAVGSSGVGRIATTRAERDSA